MVRGTTPLPHGSGKSVRVLVFAEGNAATAAREAGAEFVGFKDMIEKCNTGFQDFDVAIATPAAMAKFASSARSSDLAASCRTPRRAPSPTTPPRRSRK